MNHKPYRILWVLLILAGSALACSLFSQVTDRVGGVQETAQELVSGIVKDQKLLETAQAILTEDGSRLLKTAGSFATQEGWQLLETARAYATQEGPGMMETIQALATDKGPDVRPTLQAFATEQGPGVKATFQAFATEQGPDIVATAQGLATQMAAETPIVPEDIPLVEGERKNLTALLGMVTYSTSLPYDDVLSFYLAEMPAHGWELVNEGSYQIPNSAVLNYQKIDRKATVSMSVVNNQTYLLILIQNQ
jgi:hypothetical protein